MTTRTKAAGERGNRHLSGKHKVTGTREAKTPAVPHISSLEAPNFKRMADMTPSERQRFVGASAVCCFPRCETQMTDAEFAEFLAYVDARAAERAEREAAHE